MLGGCSLLRMCSEARNRKEDLQNNVEKGAFVQYLLCKMLVKCSMCCIAYFFTEA